MATAFKANDWITEWNSPLFHMKPEIKPVIDSRCGDNNPHIYGINADLQQYLFTSFCY
jgi:hypothetical protein